MRDPITLNLLYRLRTRCDQGVLDGYRAALERMNLVSVIQANSPPWSRFRSVDERAQRPAGHQNYLVLLFTAAPSTEFPADIWELAEPPVQ